MQVLPNYKDGSIVNLMSSISNSFGARSMYNPLKSFPPESLKSKNIILLVVDGLGMNILDSYAKDSVFTKFLSDRITSVFPSTTAAGITTFSTGLPPQQHAITGWFMNLKELGTVAMPLTFSARFGGSFSKLGIDEKKLLKLKPFSDRLKVKSFSILPQNLVNTNYTNATVGNSQRLAYKNVDGLFNKIIKATKSSNRRKYIYAYWPYFDEICHIHGTHSKKAKSHLKKFEKSFKIFIKKLKDSTLIITADHGMIGTEKLKEINLNKHKELMDCLTTCLCGDSRAAFCYVRPSKVRDFKRFFNSSLKRYCHLYEGPKLIEKNYFGLFKPNKKLFDRVGDFVILPKEDYKIKDFLFSQKIKFNIGDHGGLSKDEMIVPLIVIKS